MHNALTILEIIQLILSSGVSRKNILDFALTCRLWKGPALDQLWKDLSSVFPLLWVLAPLKVSGQAAGNMKTFWALNVPFPLPEHWDRFGPYARRVRTLTFDVSPSVGDAFYNTTFQTIAQFRPPGESLLPNLRKFTYNARRLPRERGLLPFLIFLGPSIVELELREVAQGEMGGFLAHVAQRVPCVQELTIGGNRLLDGDSTALAACLLRLEKLEFLKTSSIRLTPAVWNAMAQYPYLTYASFDAPQWSRVTSALDFHPRAFEKLGTLAIGASFDFLCSLFESQNDLPTLTRVVFEGGQMEQGRSEFRRLCKLIVQKLPNLDFVWLACHSNAVQDDEALELGDFRPLLQCKNLRYFHLAHPCGVSVTVSEMDELLDAWPRISTLALQYTPNCVDSKGSIHSIKWTPPTLQLNVLDNIAEKCPKIKELSLILDATAPINNTQRLVEPHFECLRDFTVSLSIIDDPANVASFLAQHSKRRFSLEFNIPHDLHARLRERIEEDNRKWDQVREHLQLLYDQKEKLEEDFRLTIQEERTRLMQGPSEGMASTTSISEDT